MKHKGFSLIELMVVIAIIALLAAITMPNFAKFVAKAKRAEAYGNLNAIYAAQEAHHAEHGRYGKTLAGLGGIGWKPKGACYYTYGLSASGSEGVDFFVGKLGTPASHLTYAQVNERGFVAVAAGDIDGDGIPDILLINESGQIKLAQDDLAD